MIGYVDFNIHFYYGIIINKVNCEIFAPKSLIFNCYSMCIDIRNNIGKIFWCKIIVYN